MTELIKYEAACRALADAIAVDEVLDIRDAAEMQAAAARSAGNRQLEFQAVELRMRGTRRLGEIIVRQKETVGFNRGAAAGGSKLSPRGTLTELRDSRPRLADVGITKKLSSQAQKLAALPAMDFDRLIENWRHEAQVQDGRLTTDLLRVDAEQRQRDHRPVPEGWDVWGNEAAPCSMLPEAAE